VRDIERVHFALAFCFRIVLAENRFPLFRTMLQTPRPAKGRGVYGS
jgi:hypothetical protein